MTGFHTTRWSLVIGARDAAQGGVRALDELCRVYRPPVLSYMRRHSGGDAEAEDLTQAFFEQLLRLRAHATADPRRGRFRSFLLVSMRHFLCNQADFARAAKRGGGQQCLQLDEADLACDPDTPDQAFERDWAYSVLQQALARLQGEAAAAGKLELFRAVREFLLEAPQADEYAQVAAGMAMRRNTFAVAIHRLRHRLRELVRAELADTVTEPDELDAEVAVLQRALESSDAHA